MTDTILVRRDGDIATVVLNRPEKLNALTKAMWRRLGDAFLELGADDSVRCILLRGAGERAFAPGNDIGEFENERSNVVQARAYGEVMTRTIEAIGGCRHPVVAQIHGICVGGGLEIAGLADIRICGESSRFGVPINKLGLVMAYSEIGALIRLAGEAVALEILLEGRVFDAREAHGDDEVRGELTGELRPIDVPVEERRHERALAVIRILNRMARQYDGAPLVARWHKKFARRFRDPRPLAPEDIEEGYACYGTEDFQIGRKAFLAKEKPSFKGR